MSLAPEIIALLILNALFLFFTLIAGVFSGRIALLWNASASTTQQYALFKQSVLVEVIIKYIFALKVPLFLFFIYTCDKLSNVIAGAMCASGVINSVDFGLYLTLFKLLNLYLFGFWLLLNHADKSQESMPYTRMKFVLFLLFAFPLVAELCLETLFFLGLNISKIVSCCGTLFSMNSTSYISLIFKVDERFWWMGFYVCFGMIALAYFLRHTLLLISANAFFLLFAIISLIVVFSPYVYELPTHRCLFCLLQKEYFYVGYLLYSVLFVGTFYGISGGILALMSQKSAERFFRISFWMTLLYLVAISCYPIMYYVKNGVWL